MPAPLFRLLALPADFSLLAQAWAEVWGTHKVGGSEEGGAAIALNAGIDQEGGGNSAINTLAQGIADGKTTKDEVARALRNLFRLRIRLGLLDPPMSVSYPPITHRHHHLCRHILIHGFLLTLPSSYRITFVVTFS